MGLCGGENWTFIFNNMFCLRGIYILETLSKDVICGLFDKTLHNIVWSYSEDNMGGVSDYRINIHGLLRTNSISMINLQVRYGLCWRLTWVPSFSVLPVPVPYITSSSLPMDTDGNIYDVASWTKRVGLLGMFRSLFLSVKMLMKLKLYKEKQTTLALINCKSMMIIWTL